MKMNKWGQLREHLARRKNRSNDFGFVGINNTEKLKKIQGVNEYIVMKEESMLCRRKL